MTVFYNITRRLLDEKLAIVRGGAVPKFTDLRHFFYECRNKFLRENPQFTEIDGKNKNKYAGYLKIITKWCVQILPILVLTRAYGGEYERNLTFGLRGKPLVEAKSRNS